MTRLAWVLLCRTWSFLFVLGGAGTHAAMDDHGVRFLLALRIWAYLRRSAPTASRLVEMTHRDWSWALHSQAHDILLDAALAVGGGTANASWSMLRGTKRVERAEWTKGGKKGKGGGSDLRQGR